MFGGGLARSPAVAPSHRKHDEDQKPRDIQQRMQNMIDIQNEFTRSIREEEGEEGAPLLQRESASAAPRSIMPGFYQSSEPPPPTLSDSGIGRGQIIFPSEQILQPVPPIGDFPAGVTAQTLYYHDSLGGGSEHYHDAPEYIDMVDEPAREVKFSYCCLVDPCLNCIKKWLTAENLHRSFCYGAIDGMLTGAGLVSTLTGFGLKSGSYLIAISWVACTADAICMALGHVWSTHVLSSQAAAERREEGLAFRTNRGESKAKLVDLLLSRGMLKIDAMSIADTLEGYPDIFVGALVGDDIASSTSGHDLPRTNSNRNLSLTRSYGQFSEIHNDPDTAAVAMAVGESRKEGLVMLFSFSLFGAIPALIVVLYASTIVATAPHPTSHSTSSAKHDHQQQAIMSARSAAISTTCIVMWLLGVWKRCEASPACHLVVVQLTSLRPCTVKPLF
jgi:hypothetical protein